MNDGYNRFQRKNSVSNARVGSDFELLAMNWLKQNGIVASQNFPIELGFFHKKIHRFDLGCPDPAVLVECKSHKWTEGDKTPSAKMTVWNEVMFYFSLAPVEYRKILFVLKHSSFARNETLAAYYLRTYKHLIPSDVEVWEFDEEVCIANRINLI